MDVSFCENFPDYLCVAVSAKVDIYKVTQKLFENDMKTINSLYKFNDVVTSCRLRNNRDILATGTKEGIVQIFQTKNRLSLRKYTHHKNAINYVSFNQNLVNLATCADENDVCIWELSTKDPLHIIENAHSDYIKKIDYKGLNTLITTSYDKTVKLWDIRDKTSRSDYQIALTDPVEDFTWINENLVAVANGNYVSFIDLRNSEEIVKTINAHQKTVLNIKYDKVRERLITAGADWHLKFHDINIQSGTDEVGLFNVTDEKVMYTVKLPSEILSFDISSNGENYAIGLLNGTLLVRSKKFTKEEDEQEELDAEELIHKILAKDTLVQTSKSYKYFYRGQYVKEEETDDIISKSRKKVNLQKFEKYLKKFQYKNALDAALEKNDPDIIVSLFEEFIQRSSLEIALSNRSEEELITLISFLIWKISDYRFSDLLIEVAKILIDMYSWVIGHSAKVLKKFEDLYAKIDAEIDEQKQMISVKSKLDTIKTWYNILGFQATAA